MTTQRSFKRLVRARMDKTGESYTAARRILLAADPSDRAEIQLPAPDAKIRERTGRGWEDWFAVLDEWGADQRPHKEVARWVADQLGLVPLAWEAQSVTTGYERARGLRAVGERVVGGFGMTASRTVAVPVDVLFAAFVDPVQRERWLPDAELTERTSSPPRSARFDWGDGTSRVTLHLEAKGDSKSTVTVDHSRLSGSDEVEERKVWWRSALATLKAELEGGAPDA